MSNLSACSFIFIFIFIAQELSPRKPTFPRTDQPGATSTPLKQASICEVTITKDPPYIHHNPPNTISQLFNMANGYVRPFAHTYNMNITDTRPIAGVSSSASSSSSSSAPWHGSLAPRARTRRTSLSFFLLARSHNTPFATSPASALVSRQTN